MTQLFFILLARRRPTSQTLPVIKRWAYQRKDGAVSHMCARARAFSTEASVDLTF